MRLISKRSVMLILIAQQMVSVAILAAPAGVDDPNESAPRPNILVIFTDDQGYGDVGAHGNAMIQTPNIDRLHSESVRLSNFHVDPTCSPRR